AHAGRRRRAPPPRAFSGLLAVAPARASRLMRHILARLHRPLLEQFAWSQVLVAFDFDGTLAPIVADPTAAAMAPSTRRLFREVAALYPCAVISGRSRADLAGRLRGVPLREIVGNHGLEPALGGRQRASFAAHVAR